jgi:hypothetical protein
MRFQLAKVRLITQSKGPNNVYFSASEVCGFPRSGGRVLGVHARGFHGRFIGLQPSEPYVVAHLFVGLAQRMMDRSRALRDDRKH